MKLTILHLSDLHLGNDFIPRAIWGRRGWWRPVSRELTAGLVEVIRKGREGYIVISGDFVNKAKESTFKHASAYLKSLFQSSGFDIRDRLLLIPGNHDVGFFPRKQPDDLWRLRYFREFLRGIFDEPDIEARTQRFVKVDGAGHAFCSSRWIRLSRNKHPWLRGRSEEDKLLGRNESWTISRDRSEVNSMSM